MFSNYLKIAWRNILKNKLYSFINISGLTIGMSCFVLIALYVQYELCFDSQHEKGERIYRIGQQQKGNDFRGTDMFALAPYPLATALTSDFEEVEAVANINSRWALISHDNKPFSEQGVLTDKSFFDVFSVHIISGVGKEALNEPNTILLSESLAKKIFGDDSPLDKTILYERDKLLTVKGIIADPPANQHFNYNFIAPVSIYDHFGDDEKNWASNNYHAYLLLAKGHDPKALESKMSIYEKTTKPLYEGFGLKFAPRFVLTPLKDIHLYSKMNMEISANSDIRYIYFFLTIAFIILGLASINYMNLTTARSALRNKEVGMRKSLGAGKKHIIIQFLSESFFFAFVSLLLGLLFAELLLPYFNELLDSNISLELINNYWILGGMLMLALFIGGLAGAYPALFLSGLSPTKALKGDFLKNKRGGSIIKNTLVIGQFVAANILVIGSIVIYQQLDFIQNKKLGYSKEHIVHVPYWEKEITEKQDLIKAKLLSHPNIQKVSMPVDLPLNMGNQGPINEWEGNSEKKDLFIYRLGVDYDFIDLMEMELIAGRNFSNEYATDKDEAFIINESALKSLGWENPIGKTFNGGKIIGMVKDFHLQKFDLAIEPLYMRIRPDWDMNYGQVAIKINMENFAETRSYILETMKSVLPMVPYQVKFMETSFAELYDKEVRLGKTFNIFTFLALFIACMGLFGLVSHNVVQRTKEIGIRKVIGSSAFGIVSLLSKDFMKLVFIALIVAAPLAYFLMEKWLQDFAYRIEIKWWVFAVAGAMAVAVAFATVSYQSVKAALASPIKSLRSE